MAKTTFLTNADRAELEEMIGILDDLVTDDKSNLIAAINEACTKGAGSGNGSVNNATLTLQNNTGWLYKNVAQGTECKLLFSWSSLENEVSTGAGAVTVKVGGILRYSATVNQGECSVDITNYLSAGSNAVRLSVSDVYGNSRTLAFTINVIALSMTSSFNSAIAYSGPISFTYTPIGAVKKTIHFILDGVEAGTFTTSESGRQQTFVIPRRPHGSHTFFVYCEATIDGDTVSSNGLYYDIICLEDGNDTPIVVSTFRETEAEQYVPFVIPYMVYNPASLTTVIELVANGEVVSTQTVDRTMQSWSYRPDNVGELALAIRCTGDNGEVVSKPFVIDVAETEIDVTATTNDLSLYLSSYGRSNNEANPDTWAYDDIEAQFENFNFKNDGWQLDDDGVTVLRVTGDARLTIPYQIFAKDFRTAGKTIEIEFATRDVLNYDTVLMSCMSGGIGMEVTAQRATFVSEQSTIGTQYKEEEHVRLTFVVDKSSDTKLLLCYINGILSGSVQYPDSDAFAQGVPVGISIGSNDCTTDIYCIRVYDNNLTRHQLLDNWIADTQNGVQRKERYIRNNIYDGYGQLTIDTMKKDLPYLVLSCPVLPTFKGDKKTCSGYYVDPANSNKSFEFEGAEIDVQGTSSQYWVFDD